MLLFQRVRLIKNYIPLFQTVSNRCNFSTNSMEQSSSLSALSQATWFSQYNKATQFLLRNDKQQALRSYYKVLHEIESSNQKGQKHYYRIFNKILTLNIELNRPLETQENLYKLIKVKKQLSKNPILVYEDYQNLMIHQIRHNVEKGIQLGKALLSQSQLQNLPIAYEKNIRFLLGNAYLLIGNYPDAKVKYSEVLGMSPSNILKGMASNNLAIACWWHKNPIYSSVNSKNQQIEYDQTRINRDFKQSLELLKNSIGHLENISQLFEDDSIALQNLLNQHSQSLILAGSTQNVNFQKESNLEVRQYNFYSHHSILPVYNIVQYYIYNDPIQKQLIMAWIRILLKNTSRFRRQNLLDQTTAKFFGLTDNFFELQKVLQRLILKYEQKCTIKNNLQIKNSLTLLELYKMSKGIFIIKNRKQLNSPQFKQLEKKIDLLQKSILDSDPYAPKRKYLLDIQLSFIENTD